MLTQTPQELQQQRAVALSSPSFAGRQCHIAPVCCSVHGRVVSEIRVRTRSGDPCSLLAAGFSFVGQAVSEQSGDFLTHVTYKGKPIYGSGKVELRITDLDGVVCVREGGKGGRGEGEAGGSVADLPLAPESPRIGFTFPIPRRALTFFPSLALLAPLSDY